MKVTIANKKLRIGSIAIRSVSSASLVQFGDTDIITASSLSDTPADSLIMQPLVPQQATESARIRPSYTVID